MKTKIGILGGGQLGRMLLQAASNWDLEIHVLDPDANASCATFTPYFTQGSFMDFDTVYNFGKNLEVITIEIEAVNTEALKKLESEGKKVYPQPHIIETIQNKRTQKAFYKEKGIPTSDFILIENKSEVQQNLDFLPAFQKLGTGGYDGRGVQLLNSEADLDKAFDAPSLLEKAINIDKELAVMIARNAHGEVAIFPTVEMVFDPELNLVDYLLAPARLSDSQSQEAENLALQLVEAWNLVGILAVELFLTQSGEIIVNEVAPRPHNSGHHTIEANYTSQFEQYLRAILDLPLGNTALRCPAAMVNVLGMPDYVGEAYYDGFTELISEDNIYLHLYGKKISKPGRKMGHITLLNEDREALPQKVAWAKETIFKRK
jgi:5-(carboxyamino)imidazole ribonucleotide synthase